jgi:hypothetical protein
LDPSRHGKIVAREIGGMGCLQRVVQPTKVKHPSSI